MLLRPCPDCQALTGGELCRRCLVLRLFECVLREQPPDRPTKDGPTVDFVPAGDEATLDLLGCEPLRLTVEAENMVGHYELLEEIAQGGMGVVWRCYDHVLRRHLAMKFLKERYCTDANFSDFCRRFQREARVLGDLQHPGIVPIHQSGTFSDGRPFFVMKLVKGRTLAQLLEDQGPGAARWLAVFAAVCQAVAYAHSVGVIHRDLKPSNVMVGAFGEVQVMDVGVAKVLPWSSILRSGPPAVWPTSSDWSEDAIQTYVILDECDDHTVPGSVMGTCEFMPPEQAQGLACQADERSDVFGKASSDCCRGQKSSLSIRPKGRPGAPRPPDPWHAATRRWRTPSCV
jgi:serine/threonine protein kinase